MGIVLELETSGPFFDGSLQQKIESAQDEIEANLAQEGINLIHQRLHTVLRHPTGRYESNIQIERRSDSNIITDGGMVYGPWLEGIGSRNASSRFKGYSTFRQIAPQVEAMAEKVADEILEQKIGGM